MNSRDLFYTTLESNFNIKHPPRGAIIIDEITLEYLPFRYNYSKI